SSSKHLLLEIFKQNTGELIKSVPLALLQPLGDIAEEAVSEDAAARYLKTGVRVGLKHIGAILAAYATYKAIVNKSDFFAKSAALLQYTGSTKLIALTEKADTRYWSTLPKDIRMGQTFIPSGEYEIKAKFSEATGGAGKSEYHPLGFVTVKDEKVPRLFNFQLTKVNP
ncbi:MAG: hypothetical protein HQK53_16920, partial [Oligoflexia bacterium]|nr:hypothetical protein [Oligoflexia bacterium]